MAGPLFDCYVIAPDRTAAFAARFLDEFLPERAPSLCGTMATELRCHISRLANANLSCVPSEQ
jgi:hypothetical protein